MMISTKGRYALRVMLDLAAEESDRFLSLKDVAQRQGISVKYLEAIVAMLNRAGLQRTCDRGDGLQVLRGVQLVGIAQPDHQHARRDNAIQIVNDGGLADLAAGIATLNQGFQAPIGRAVERGSGGVQGFVGEHANDDAVRLYGSELIMIQVEFEGHAADSRK